MKTTKDFERVIAALLRDNVLAADGWWYLRSGEWIGPFPTRLDAENAFLEQLRA